MKTVIPETGEKRRHARTDLVTAILVSPNGHENRTLVFDLSESGAKVGLPTEFEHGVGASLRLYFPLEHSPTVMLGARIVRVAIDHLGVEFSSGQIDKVHGLIDELIKSP